MYLEQDEEIYAFCYIGKQGDEKNKCLLSNKHLIIIRKGRPHYFPAENILDISFKQRRLLLPLVAGGIIVPFSLLLIFRNAFHTWPVLFLLFGGIFLLYFGYIGRLAITIQTIIKEYDVFVQEATPNLEAFINFANQHIKNLKNKNSENPDNLLKIVLYKEEWVMQKENDFISSPFYKKEGFEEAFTKEMEINLSNKLAKLKTPAVLIYLNPLKIKAEVKFEPAHDGRLAPRIYGKINKDAIEKIEELD